MLSDVRIVVRDVGGVDDEHEVAGGEPVDEQIVDKSALRRRQRGVLRLPHFELGSVVRRDALDGGKRILAGDLDFPHVADVEHPRPLADGHVLGRDPGIFHGHFPAAEWHHARARGAMASVQRGFLEGCGRGLFHLDVSACESVPEQVTVLCAFARGQETAPGSAGLSSDGSSCARLSNRHQRHEGLCALSTGRFVR